MPVHRGRRPGTYRVRIWARGHSHEWIIPGTKGEAVAFEARKRVELRAKSSSSRVSPSFSSFASETYEPHAERCLGVSTWHKVRVYQVRTLEKVLGALKLDQLRPEDVEAFKTKRLQDGRKASSINNELRVLRTMLRWAEEQGIPVAPVKIKMLARAGKPRIRCWSVEQVNRLYLAAKAEPAALLVEPLLVFLLNTGVRKGEAIAAEWSWIDWRGKMLRIPVTEYWRPKDKEAREVPLSEGVLSTLRTLDQRTPRIFPTARGGGPHLAFPQKTFNRVRKRAGLVGGPHTTRHTFASHFLQAVPDLQLLAQVLGHSHTRVTELYTHLLPGHLDRARNAVDLRPPSKAWAKRALASAKVSSRA